MPSADNISSTYMHKPCRDCPFRKDSLKGWLGRGRMQEIVDAATFVCHKDNSRQCSGHMQVSRHSLFTRAAESMSIRLRLSGKGLLFDSPEEAVTHHDHVDQ